jgi:hypothetical protein
MMIATVDSRLVVRQAARIVFGTILFIGAGAIVLRMPFGLFGHEIADVLAWTWLAAICGALATRVVASFLPSGSPSRSLLHLSFVVPAIGIALVLPLSLHLIYFVLFEGDLRGFNEWATYSMVFAGLAHVVFATLTAVRASQLARGKSPMGVGVIYAGSVAAGMIPLPVIPCLLIAITGIPIVPLLHLMKPLAARERAALETLPRAVARPA